MSKQPPGYPTHYAPPAYHQQPQQQQQQQYYPSMPPPMYPSASYPQQQSYVPMTQPMQQSSSQYGVPPPAYTSTPQPMYSQTGPQLSYPVQQVNQVPMMQQHVMPMSQGSFDAGARFGVGATANVPPPPPGCPPTQAQIAAAQGRPVLMRQNPDNWLSGGSDGGYTVW